MALSVSIEPASLSCCLHGKAQRHNHAVQKLQVRNAQSKIDTSVNPDKVRHFFLHSSSSPVFAIYCIFYGNSTSLQIIGETQ